MSMKRFVAPTARDCLRRVKEELGPDAIVVSNKPVSGGVEIVAMTSEGFDALSRQVPSRDVVAAAPERRMAPPATVLGAARQAYAANAAPLREVEAGVRSGGSPGQYGEDDYTVRLSPQARRHTLQPPPWAEQMPTGRAPLRSMPRRDANGVVAAGGGEPVLKSAVDEPIPPIGPRPAVTSATAGPVLQEDSGTQLQVARLMGEMQTIKALLERQLAGFAWGEMSRESPVRALALAEMLEAGFSGQLSRKLCQEMPVDLNIDDARKWLKSAFNRRLRTLGSDNDIIDRGGVYALVGPTGVGKTTTTAKLAARCVVRYGADKIALLTTDGYRIGAHEQLRIYGRILGVPVHVVRDGEDLRHTLADLRDKHMVLIDTVGMSQRDRMVAEQAAMLMRSGEVNRLLLLNATSRGDTLDDVVRAYAGEDMAGVILSKVDEAASIAPALDVVARHGLLLCYIANGQRVPEDMHLPNRNYLMHRAFKLPGDVSPHRLQADEAGLMMAQPQSRQAVGGVVV